MSSALISALQLGRVPRVVGTIITAEYLKAWQEKPKPFHCDLIELRVDGFPDFPDWLKAAKQIEHQGTPVFATVRLKNEGGHWTGSDMDRWGMIEAAIRQLSGVDVELQSGLAAAASELAGQLGKLAIFSFHDFTRTPPVNEMEMILTAAHRLGGIGKIAATANLPEDVEALRGLLRRSWTLPVCVIGMGALGQETRLKFPFEGSCFTYGYLDTPGAPGQYSALELTRHFAARRAGTA